MNWKKLGVIILVIGLVLLFALFSTGYRSASEWQAESWMEIDTTISSALPSRILALTDLPSLSSVPRPADFLAAINKSRQAGCNGAVLTYSWPSLEASEGRFTLEALKHGVIINKGRVLFLGIQVINTTAKDLPADLQMKQFDDRELIERFLSFLDALAPLLRNRVSYLSIGNETDIYLAQHPDEIKPFRVFLDAAQQHLKQIAPNLTIGTTLTDAGVLQTQFQEMVEHTDAYFLTYYHGQAGVEGVFKDPTRAKEEILALAFALDNRPIIFQEVGFPAHENFGSPEKQADFINGVFDAWAELGDRIPFLNYFMMYDFPETFVRQQVSYYGVTESTEPLVNFLTSLGLHDSGGNPRPGWDVFARRGRELNKPSLLKGRPLRTLP